MSVARRTARALALLALAWAALLAGVAQAQTPTTLVSNTEGTQGNSSTDIQAQSFTTGPNPTGYALSDVQLKLGSTSSTSATVNVVKIFSNSSSSEPGTVFVTLRNPTALTAGAINTFTAPDGVTLNPNTTYWVVVNDGVTTDPILIHQLAFNDEDTAQTGWNIVHSRLRRTSPTDSWTTRGFPLLLAIRGVVNEAPPPLVSNTGQTATSTGSNFVQAQPFTTGPNPAGYALSDVQVMLDATSSTSATGSVVRIFSHDTFTNLPGIELFVLGNPETLTAGGLNTFTAPDYVTLSPNTDYWVVINGGVTNPITASRTLSAAEGTAEEGWSIGNSRLYYSQGAWDTGPDPILLAIRGVANEGPPTLVANTAQTATSTGSNFILGQPFTTGPNPTGYALSDIQVVLHANSATSATGSVVRIFSHNAFANLPDTKLFALGNPAALTAGALNTFTAPEGVTLAPNTVYWVVINDGAADPITVLNTLSTVEGTAEEGWSIGDDQLSREDPTDDWEIHSDIPSLLAIRGSANEVPPPFASYTNADGGEVLWATTMTAGRFNNEEHEVIHEGFNSAAQSGLSIPIGSLSGTPMFAYERTNYVVQHIINSVTHDIINGVTYATIDIKFSSPLPSALIDRLALVLDGTEYLFRESFVFLPDGALWLPLLPPTWTENQEVSVQLIAFRPPGPPGNFAAGGGDGRAALSWADPVVVGGLPVTKYQYRYATGGRTPDSEWLDVPDSNIGEANRNSYTIGNLTNDVPHTFELRAVSAAGAGEAVRARVTPRGSSVQHGGTTTVLSNLGQTTETDSLVMDADITYTRDPTTKKVTAVHITKMGYGYAQTFSTGSDGHLFKLDYVDIKFATAGSGDGNDVNGDVILAALWEWDAAARAVTRFVGQFERKQAADGNTRFAYHHRGENLQASTTYAIVIDAKDIENTTATLAQTASDVDDVSRSGWNLDGFSYRKPFNRSAKEAWTKLDNALQVKINARQGSAAGGLYIHDAEVYEAHGATLDFKVTLDPAPGTNPVTVEYRTLDSSIGYCSGSFFDDAAGQCRTTARTPADYAYTEGTLTFASGETLKTIEVPVVDDRIEDSGEGVEMILLNPSRSFLSRDAAIGIIYNDEEAALPSEVTINSPSATEGATLDFVVSLSEATTATVTLDYATSDATAVAQSDYEAKSGTIELPAGATSATISVALVDDAEAEGDETLTLTLSNLERAVFAAGADSLSATGTIEDNDESTAGTPAPGDSTATDANDDNEQHDRPHALQATATEEAVVLTWQDPDTHPSNNLYHILRHRPELGEAEPEVYAEYASITDRTFADSAVTAGVLYGYAVRAVKDALGYLGPMSEIVKVRMPADTSDSATEDGGSAPAPGDSTATDTTGDKAPLTATFRNVPEEHDGETTFFFQVLFSEEIPTSYTVLRDDGAFEVTGGALLKARRVDGRDDLREIHIEPSGGGDVFVLLPETTDCDAAGAICMGGDDGRKLSTADSARVAGPAGGSVSGRMEQEGSAAMATASEDVEEELPDEVMLMGNYPNPFNPRTTIRYALPASARVRLSVYDMLGQEVAVLVDETKPAGHHTTRFDAGDLPSGAYVYRLQAQGRIIVRTMMLVK